jgi:hypothetical protein
MQTKHRITRVDITDPENTRIYLDDGSELTGILSVDASSSVDSRANHTQPN